jgi:hypothetical protein
VRGAGAVFALLALVGAAAAGEPAPVRMTVLPETEAAGALAQCSRPTVAGANAYFVPSLGEIAAAERGLAAWMAQPGGHGPAAPASEYVRQYVGVVAGGRRLLYLNLFHESALADVPEWQSRAVVVCDGGDRFWGISYDLESGTFGEPAFNGEG